VTRTLPSTAKTVRNNAHERWYVDADRAACHYAVRFGGVSPLNKHHPCGDYGMPVNSISNSRRNHIRGSQRAELHAQKLCAVGVDRTGGRRKVSCLLSTPASSTLSQTQPYSLRYFNYYEYYAKLDWFDVLVVIYPDGLVPCTRTGCTIRRQAKTR
jgi:hypothetical protein